MSYYNIENLNINYEEIKPKLKVLTDKFEKNKPYFEELTNKIVKFFKSFFGEDIIKPFINWVDNKYPNKQDRIVFWIVFTIISVILLLFLIFYIFINTINFVIRSIFWLLYELTFGVFFWILRFLYKGILFIFGIKK